MWIDSIDVGEQEKNNTKCNPQQFSYPCCLVWIKPREVETCQNDIFAGFIHQVKHPVVFGDRFLIAGLFSSFYHIFLLFPQKLCNLKTFPAMNLSVFK